MSITMAHVGHGPYRGPLNHAYAETTRAWSEAASDWLTEALRIHPTTISWNDETAPRQQRYFGAFYC
jgi:hypothetical protein